MSDRELSVLRFIGRRLPRIPHASGIANRLLKPLYLRKRRAPVVCDVLGIQMELDPSEAVDGNLLFCPQLYDTAEIAYLQSALQDGDTFVDIGAHIGFYALMAARRMPRGTVVAIEASPFTYRTLERNVRLNDAPVIALQCGVSDRNETLALHLQERGNRGGNSFVAREGQGSTVAVPCRPLLDILRQVGVARVDGMKIDVEGFEDKVLRHFFTHAPRALWPRFIITEFYGGTHLELLAGLGYREERRTPTNRILSSDGSWST
ncbi:MAG TPA: FkbM family methyltransferase [Gemmatimonadales bacterium]|nr:FkbM family methyltransferase [Gemmatimonadales bacterium]